MQELPKGRLHQSRYESRPNLACQRVSICWIGIVGGRTPKGVYQVMLPECALAGSDHVLTPPPLS